MAKRLLIVRDPESPLLRHINLDKNDYEIVLIQNAVNSEELRAKNAKTLDVDANARKVVSESATTYDEIIEKIFEADKAICI